MKRNDHHPRAAVLGVVVVVMCIVSVFNLTSAAVRNPIRAVDQHEFSPVVIASASSVGIVFDSRSALIPARKSIRQLPQEQQTPESKVIATGYPSGASLTRSIRGQASWYCSISKPICHYRYPPGSMVAAACSALRMAIGKEWRGKTVTVVHGSATVSVTLVDWCGSTSKLIDLYREPMRRLGGSGVLRVLVRW